MNKVWVCGDHHFGHRNILNFRDESGALLRGAHFKDIEEHDSIIIDRHNELVHPSDRVYLLGDVAIARRSISNLGRLNGRLVLVKGNHDIFAIKDYLPYIDDVRAYVVQRSPHVEGAKVILSHIPVHPDSVGRFGTNIHGHLHQHKIDDPRYVCVSLEHTNYAPIEVQEALNSQRPTAKN